MHFFYKKKKDMEVYFHFCIIILNLLCYLLFKF